MKVDFNSIDYTPQAIPPNEVVDQYQTSEGIEIKSIYTAEDLKSLSHIGYASGIPPYLRGPYSSMYSCLLYTSPSPRD